MKRSEMVNIIAECLIEPHYEDPTQEADYILRKIERRGMIPPESYHEFKNMGSNEWEPEDDDKYCGAV